ncbi:MAG TPA: hypothetical protein VN727_05410 [Candidatus Binatia bacterium]|nr:hypothetical protein [Candidatus Binatia bacterium]
MADWRQIQARIRKAKNSLDPAAKLSDLYQRTRDGMVAWEIGAVEEKNGRSDEAVKWYKVAAEKFRRADWKKKAEDALARLGAEAPEKHETVEDGAELHKPMLIEAEREDGHEEQAAPLALGEIVEEADDEATEDEVSQSNTLSTNAQPGGSGDAAKKKRRRGRRGGRGRRRKGNASASPGLPAQAFASSGSSAQNLPSARAPQPIAAAAPQQERASYDAPQREPQRPSRSDPAYQAPQLPSERAAHGRSDPALSSRMAHLESLLRRLMQSPLHRLGEAEEAPAGPGVFLLSEADQSGSYYVESCQTLRVGVGNLVRGVRTQKGNRSRFNETNLKQQLAEYLGISEAKVSQYLKDHCVVRWIQLDEEASNLAHFAIGILRTPLNID